MKFAALGAIYNGDQPQYLNECLYSLSAQTRKIPIYIVVDGPINPNLEKVIKTHNSLDIVYFRLKDNVGLAKSLAHVIRHIGSEFDYLIRFDADDVNHIERFEVMINFIKKNRPDLVSSHMNEIDDKSIIFSRKVVPVDPKDIKRVFPYRNPINHPASAFNVKSVIDSGGYKEMPFFEDYYLWARMYHRDFKIMNIDKTLVNFRATELMLNRRYGFAHFKDELHFIRTINNEGIFSAYQNFLSLTLRAISKLFGFKIYKYLYFSLREKPNN